MPGPVHMLYPHRSALPPFHPAQGMARRAGLVRARSATNTLVVMLLALIALFMLAGTGPLTEQSSASTENENGPN